MKRLPIKVGFCVAYDWQLLKHSIPLIYDGADEICLSLDKDRTSWSGKIFEFDSEGFFALVQELDVAGKISIYEDDFHKSELLPMENEVRQRRLMTEFMGSEDCWYIQLDADEYFLDFCGFTSYLQKLNTMKRKVNVCCPWITIYKQLDNDYFLIYPNSFRQHEFIQVATRWPVYEHGRRNGYFNILTDFFMLHQSWGRGEKEVQQKLMHWGHSNEIDVDKYFQLWKNCNATNYSIYKDFHHLGADAWPALIKVEAEDIEKLKEKLLQSQQFKISANDLLFSNSIWVSRLKALVKAH